MSLSASEEAAVPIQRIDEALEGRQVERVRALRARRDAGVHAAALRRVEDAARGGENLMPRILACGGELCDGGGDCECAASGCLGSIGRRWWSEGFGLRVAMRHRLRDAPLEMHRLCSCRGLL